MTYVKVHVLFYGLPHPCNDRSEPPFGRSAKGVGLAGDQT